MQKSLNSYFNFDDIPQYYFFVQNFGPFLQMNDFIHIKQTTCLSGPNGSGKSSLLDAIKTAIIANQRYLSYNPKSGKHIELNNYLNLFGSKKNGPTLLIFSIILPNKQLGYEKAVFGAGWDYDNNGKFFFKENMSKEEILPIIKKSTNLTSFFREIAKAEYPGVLHGPWSEVLNYHKFLDQNGIFFFFPYGYDDSKSYHQFLKLLKDCSNTLTSTTELNPNQLKKDLFRPHKTRDDLIASFEKIERGMQTYREFHSKREKQQVQMESIREIIEIYQKYYLENFIDGIASKIIEKDLVRKTYNSKIVEISQKIEKNKDLIDEKNLEIKQKLKEYKYTNNLYNEIIKIEEIYNKSYENYINNQKYIDVDFQNLSLEKGEMEKKKKK